MFRLGWFRLRRPPLDLDVEEVMMQRLAEGVVAAHHPRGQLPACSLQTEGAHRPEFYAYEKAPLEVRFDSLDLAEDASELEIVRQPQVECEQFAWLGRVLA